MKKSLSSIRWGNNCCYLGNWNLDRLRRPCGPGRKGWVGPSHPSPTVLTTVMAVALTESFLAIVTTTILTLRATFTVIITTETIGRIVVMVVMMVVMSHVFGPVNSVVPSKSAGTSQGAISGSLVSQGLPSPWALRWTNWFWRRSSLSSWNSGDNYCLSSRNNCSNSGLSWCGSCSLSIYFISWMYTENKEAYRK